MQGRRKEKGGDCGMEKSGKFEKMKGEGWRMGRNRVENMKEEWWIKNKNIYKKGENWKI